MPKVGVPPSPSAGGFEGQFDKFLTLNYNTDPMSPEYKKVFIPTQSVESFEKLIQELGGNFEGKRSLPEEFQDELEEKWLQEVNLARPFVAKFLEAKADPLLETAVNKGITNLVSDAVAVPLYRNPINGEHEENFNLASIKQEIENLFLESLPDKIPDNYSLQTGLKGNVLVMKKIKYRPRLRPRQIVCLINQYNLAEGNKKTKRELAKGFGLTESTIATSLYGGIRVVQRRLISGREKFFKSS